MRKLAAILGILGGAFLACSVQAAYVNDRLLFEEKFDSKEALAGWKAAGRVSLLEKQGPDGGNAVRFQAKNGNATISRPMDPGTIRGMIAFEADVRGRGLVRGAKPYFGPKFMLFNTNGKRASHPEPMTPVGTYEWRKIRKYFLLPPDTERIGFMVGIQEAFGTFEVANIRIWSVKEVPDSEVKAVRRENREAASIPRGPGKGTKYRGFMSGHDLSPAAFETLKSWNVNLLRFQMNPRKYAGKDRPFTPEEYLRGLDREIARLDSILPLAKRAGIRIAIDLHTGPGTTMSKVASNILTKETSLDTLDEAWRRLANHYKGNPQIYGYDLLNEPVTEQFGFTRTDKSPWKQMAQRLVNVIRRIDPDTPIIVAWEMKLTPVEGTNIIYTPHYYSPHSYSHQGVLGKLKWGYPGEIDGIYWDKEQLRVAMKEIIEFQRKYRVPIFIGEFSAVNTAKGADQYLKDCIELFEEYGWDWAYHAFREWPPWSIEHEDWAKPSKSNPRKTVLLNALKKNVRQN